MVRRLPRHQHPDLHLPPPTVAAVNGHAFAGGLITSAVCDHRIAIDTDARFALNEVPIGIPCRRYTSASSLTPGARRPPPAPACSAKPSARTRRCNSASLTSSSQRTSCSTAPSRSPSRSLATASSSTPSPKRATQAAALRDIADLADPLDTELPTWMTSDNSQHAHRRYWTQLKSAEPRW
ncbi:MAG: enoyl-CoA hydratase/isomerase family protein [Pseudonocardia sp.]